MMTPVGPIRTVGLFAPLSRALLLVLRDLAPSAWALRRERAGWQLLDGFDPDADSVVSLSQDLAWRLFTRGTARGAAERGLQIEGDRALGATVLDLVSIMA